MIICNNTLEGSIPDSLTNSRSLNTIVISQNKLTGTIPSELSNILSLESFVADNNCLIGHIPVELCLLTNLVELVLDGMGANCKNYIFPSWARISSAYILPIEDGNNINECIFSMPKLEVLHLSGIGLSGTISNSVKISKSLNELSLSNNFLHGPIPDNILKYNWSTLDLSFNRFGGSLEGIEHKIPVLYAQSNRLSGNIPSLLLNLSNISILFGNIFSCSIISPILPLHDPVQSVYECGTNNYDISVYFMVIFLFIPLIIKVTKWFLYHIFDSDQFVFNKKIMSVYTNFLLHFNKNLNILKEKGKHKDKSNITLLCNLYDELISILWNIMLIYIFILFPISVILNNYSGIYDFSGLFDYSYIYLSGIFPAIVCTAIMLLLIWNIHKYFLVNDDHLKHDNKMSWWNYFVLTLLFLLNGVIFGVLNLFYIGATFYLKGFKFTLVQIGVAVTKYIWNIFILPYLVKSCKSYYFNNNCDDDDVSVNLLSFQSWVGLFNYFVMPLFVNLIISYDCFYNVFNAASSVTSIYSFTACDNFSDSSDNCVRYSVFTSHTSYDPPFVYSYECISNVIALYAPIYMFMSFCLLIQTPIVKILVFCRCGFFLPNDILLKENIEDNNKKFSLCCETNQKIYFDQSEFIISIVTFFSMSLSIGILIPFVGMVCCFCLIIFIHNSLSRLGERLSMYAEDKEKFNELISCYEKESENTRSKLLYCSRNIILTCIWTIFLSVIFDTLGDKIGYKEAFMVNIILFFFIFARVYVQDYFISFIQYFCKNKNSGESTQNELKIMLINY